MEKASTCHFEDLHMIFLLLLKLIFYGEGQQVPLSGSTDDFFFREVRIVISIYMHLHIWKWE